MKLKVVFLSSACTGLSVVSCGAALPEAWAPFESVNPERREVEVLDFLYRTGPVWGPSKEQYRWVELKAGDKSVLLSGTDRRIPGMPNGGAGWGHFGFYARKNIVEKPGIELLGRIQFVLNTGNDPWDEPWPSDTVAVKDGVVERTRQWKMCGTNGLFRYTAKVTGPGRARIDWDAGVDETTWRSCRLGERIKFKRDYVEREDPSRRISVTMSEPGPRGTIDIDFHESCVARIAAKPPVGGVDFWRTDAYDVPVKPTRNQVMNGSFEQGLKGWTFLRGPSHEVVTNNPGMRFVRVEEGGKFGRHALHILSGAKDVSFGSAPMQLNPGRRYVLSYWAKRDPGSDADFYTGMRPAAREAQQEWVGGKVPDAAAHAGAEWTRHEVPFVANAEGELILFWSGGNGGLLVDGVQIEEGERATSFAVEPVEARLVTSDEFNYLRLPADGAAKLELSGRPSLRGRLQVRINNFYHEVVFKRDSAFALDGTGSAVLPLEGVDLTAFGKGVFIVCFEFAADGKTWRDYCRYSVVDPLKGEHALAKFFTCHPWFMPVFGNPMHEDMSETMVKRMIDWGIGSVACEYRAHGHWRDFFNKWGFRNYQRTLTEELARFYPDRFGWGKPGLRAHDKATPEDLKFIEESAYRAAREAEEGVSSRYWALAGEEEIWLPVVMTDHDFDRYFKLQYACWKGLKRGFDERGMSFKYAPSQGTSAFFHSSQQMIIDGYLAAADKQGFRYDYVCIHNYHSVDGGSLGLHDRDQDLQALIAILRKHGYDDSVTISVPEGYNMLPMHIPAWRAIDWADVYQGTIPSHALGNRETVQAASLMRGSIIDLKYYPRMLVEHNWMHRPILDMELTPYCLTMSFNTLGHLLPDPRFYGDAKPYPDIRGYVFRRSPASDEYVLAVWTTNHDVENGARRGDTLEMDLPSDATFYDFCGNERVQAERGKVPLTYAPLFVKSKDPAGLLAALRNAKGGTTSDPGDVQRGRALIAKCVEGAPDWTKVDAAPAPETVKGKATAEVKLAYGKDRLYLRVEAKNAKNPKLTVAFDGLADARKSVTRELAADDIALLFDGEKMSWVKEPNTQFRYGGAAQALSEAQYQAEVKRTFVSSSDGGTWTLEFSHKAIAPIRPGTCEWAGISLAVVGEDGEIAVARATDEPQWLPKYGKGPTGWTKIPVETSATAAADGLYQTHVWMFSLPATVEYAFRKPHVVRAFRICWREGCYDPDKGINAGPVRYRVHVRRPDDTWQIACDASANDRDLVTDYRETEPLEATAIRLEVLSAPKKLELGLSEWTVFGTAAVEE